MIRLLTIIENITENGEVHYTINGNLPLVNAAQALVLISFESGKTSVPPVNLQEVSIDKKGGEAPQEAIPKNDKI